MLFFLTLTIASTSLAAKKEDYWLKVESEEKKPEEVAEPATYPFDSLGAQQTEKKFSEIGFWSLKPKLVLAAGFHGDKAFFTEDRDNRWFFNTSLKFRNRPWHRWSGGVQLLQNNSLFVHGAWEYTPSRKAMRHYHGVGASLRLVSEKEFRNLVETDNYYFTVNTGIEFLQKSQRAWIVELKGMVSTEDYVLQLAIGYVFNI